MDDRNAHAEIAVILRRLDEQDKMLGKIMDQGSVTNGRVGKTELQLAIQQDREVQAGKVRERLATDLSAAQSKHERRINFYMGLFATVCTAMGGTITYLAVTVLHHAH
jgi:hypothetical protein